MSKGLDVNERLTAHTAAALYNDGFRFVARYINASKKSCLTRAEATIIAKAGMSIVSIWERGFPTEASYFTIATGHADGSDALATAELLGMPKGKPVYFAIDYDATDPEIEAHVKPYYVALRSHLLPHYAAGAYGSGLVLSHLKAAGLSSYLWQAFPTGWAGYDSVSPLNLRQTSNGTILEGLNVDIDVSNGNGGGWVPV